LEKLQVSYIDFYLFHGLRKSRWETVKNFNLLKWAEKALADGRIRHMGFSFHDNFDVFKEIIDSFDLWSFCQIQYNYVDINNQAGRKGVEYAASKGLGIVVMEPLLGGRLVDPPESVKEMWDSAPVQRKPADWALQWVWNQPEISVALSGMSTMQHVLENVESASNSGVQVLTSEDLGIVDKVREKYRELCPIPCTKCEYCLPCSVDLNIPRLFDTLNRGAMYNKLDMARGRYGRLSSVQRASACIQCKECESKCPQSIPISEWMVKVDEILGQGMDLESCVLPDD
jgi:predicted aldo/keto reductase-like oxidoreductase